MTDINFRRGILAAATHSLGGLFLLSLAVGANLLFSWVINGANAAQREAELSYWKLHSATLLLGVGTYLACAAWATYAPNGKNNFTKTLVVLFATGIPLTYLLFELQAVFPAFDRISLNDQYLLLPPPIIISLLIVQIRCEILQALKIESADEEKKQSQEQRAIPSESKAE